MDFGVNPDDDPELALALRASMEEQQEVLLQRALAMSMESEQPVASAGAGHRDLIGRRTFLEQVTNEEAHAHLESLFCQAIATGRWVHRRLWEERLNIKH